MDRNQFWTLVEAADATSEEGCERLTGRLSTLSPEDIEGFARTLEELRAAAYRWDLWGAAYVANGGCSDDGFEYFRAWLVTQGRAVYEAASQDPDAIAAHVIPDDCECESLLYVAHEAYERRTGRSLPAQEVLEPDRPTGEPWNFDDAEEMRRRYPRLCRRVNL